MFSMFKCACIFFLFGRWLAPPCLSSGLKRLFAGAYAAVVEVSGPDMVIRPSSGAGHGVLFVEFGLQDLCIYNGPAEVEICGDFGRGGLMLRGPLYRRRRAHGAWGVWPSLRRISGRNGIPRLCRAGIPLPFAGGRPLFLACRPVFFGLCRRIDALGRRADALGTLLRCGRPAG